MQVKLIGHDHGNEERGLDLGEGKVTRLVMME
jgi:hypothetical protein